MESELTIGLTRAEGTSNVNIDISPSSVHMSQGVALRRVLMVSATRSGTTSTQTSSSSSPSSTNTNIGWG